MLTFQKALGSTLCVLAICLTTIAHAQDHSTTETYDLKKFDAITFTRLLRTMIPAFDTLAIQADDNGQTLVVSAKREEHAIIRDILFTVHNPITRPLSVLPMPIVERPDGTVLLSYAPPVDGRNARAIATEILPEFITVRVYLDRGTKQLIVLAPRDAHYELSDAMYDSKTP